MNVQAMMKEVQKMQKRTEEMFAQLAKEEVEASAGGGMINVKFNGTQELLSIEIDEEVIKSGDKEMLQDLVLAAVNEGFKRSKALSEEKLRAITGGMNIPGLF